MARGQRGRGKGRRVAVGLLTLLLSISRHIDMNEMVVTIKRLI
jgi:hypothetical protein